MFATMNSDKVLFTLICIGFSCFSFALMSCDTNSDMQELRAARDRAEKRAAAVTAELKDTKTELERVKAELRRGIPESAQKRIIELEKLVEKLPQATIENVRVDPKKKDMDIYVTIPSPKKIE